MLLFIICILAGALTVLAPCVLPVLPVIIGGSLDKKATKQSKRPYIVAAGLVGSIVVFTLLLKASTALVNLSPHVLTDVSGGIVIALGLASLFPKAWDQLLIRTGWQAKAQRLLGTSEQNTNEYAGPLLTGVALGPVFSTCSPTYAFILASVLPRNFGTGLIYLLAYCVGLAATLLVVVVLGKKAIGNAGWLLDTHGWFRRAFGALFILIGIAIIAGWLVSAELWVARHSPISSTRIEQSLLNTTVKNDKIKTTKNSKQADAVDPSLFNVPGKVAAPELAGLTDWINSNPQTLESLKGKVVLLDFWTYSCINCIRTLPYVQQWYSTYKDQGFVVLGIHTPEFAFEHVPSNVQDAAKKYGLTYPIALDNNYGTWNAFGNNSWPAHYLIDREGNVRDVHLGEGDYDKTEKAIQALLGSKGPVKSKTAAVTFNKQQTPETYLGSARTEGFVGTPSLAAGKVATYSAADNLPVNRWTLSGRWKEESEHITSSADGSTLQFHVQAKDVYVVASTADGKPGSFSVSLPGGDTAYGADAPNGQVTVNGSRLYHVVSLPAFGQTTATFIVPAGVSLYAFTFGG